MIQKKICMLGGFSVGKTSLTRRFVSSLFDDKYLTTLGVKVDKKVIFSNDIEMTLMIWDLAGEDEFSKIKASYLRGAAGYILVVDGTRPQSLKTALSVHANTQSILGRVPCMLALNKADRKEEWLINEEEQQSLKNNFQVLETSAKTGNNVENLFINLAASLQ